MTQSDSFNPLNTHIQNIRPAFFGPEFGFESFQKNDFDQFVFDPDQFVFQFKKVKGRGVLYGPVHVKARQYFFNHLLTSQRCDLFASKWNRVCQKNPEIKERYEWVGHELIDVQDVGMGQTVYACYFKDKGPLIIKKGGAYHSLFYRQLQSLFYFPTVDCEWIAGRESDISVMDYISDQHVVDYLQHHTLNSSHRELMARHMALGDIFGRGDRHLENYMINGSDIIPIDISLLYWPTNESYVQSYIRGNMTELSILSQYWNDLDDYSEKLSHFLDHYWDQLQCIHLHRQGINRLIDQWYGDIGNANHKKDYYFRKCRYLNVYFYRFMTRYLTSLAIAFDRSFDKNLLLQLVTHYPDETFSDSWLKMYYFADKDRLSTFFMSESHHSQVTDRIRSKAIAHSLISTSECDDHNQAVLKFKTLNQSILKQVMNGI